MIYIFTLSILIGLAAPYIYMGWFYFYKRSALQATTVIAQYTPPYGLTPAEIGFLYDHKLTNREVWATLFDLEQRHIIRLDIYEKKAVVKALQQTNNLKIHEERLLRIARKYDGLDDEIITKEIVGVFKLYVRDELLEKGYIRNSKLEIALGVILFISALIVAANGEHINIFTTISFDSYIFSSSSITPFVLAPFFVIYLTGFYFLPRLTPLLQVRTMTKKLRKAWPAIDGYRLYLEKVDKNIIAHATSRKQLEKTESFPYVIALGLYPTWRKLLLTNKSK